MVLLYIARPLHKYVQTSSCPVIFNQYHQVKTTLYITRQEEKLDMPSYRIEYGAWSVQVVYAKLCNKLKKDTENRKLKPCFSWKKSKRYISKFYLWRSLNNKDRSTISGKITCASTCNAEKNSKNRCGQANLICTTVRYNIHILYRLP